MTAQVLLLAALAVALGSLVQGTVGFGAALISSPLLLLIEPSLVPGPATVATIFLSVLVLVHERAHVDRGGLRWALVGLGPGTVAATFALAQLDQTALAATAAMLILVAVVVTASGLRVEPNRRSQLLAGIASGFIGTTASTGGPPIALLHQHAPAQVLRPTLARFFLFASALTLTSLALAGRLSTGDVGTGLVLAPACVVGFAGSFALRGRLDPRRSRWAVLAISAASALAVLVRLAV